MNLELSVILHGFEVALMRGYDKVIIETNCMIAVEMLMEGQSNTATMAITRRIKTMQRQFANVKV